MRGSINKTVLASLVAVCVVMAGCGNGNNTSATSGSGTGSSGAGSSQSAAGGSISGAGAQSSAVSSSSAGNSVQSSAAGSSGSAVTGSSSAGAGTGSAAGGSSVSSGGAGKLEQISNPEVKVVEEKQHDTSVKYLEYEADNSVIHLIFSADKPIKNFRIVNLFAKNIDNDGNVEFLYTEAFRTDALKPELAVRAGVDLGETIPLVGYMYTDDSGRDRLFPIGQSGLDGSLIVWEYTAP